MFFGLLFFSCSIIFQHLIFGVSIAQWKNGELKFARVLGSILARLPKMVLCDGVPSRRALLVTVVLFTMNSEARWLLAWHWVQQLMITSLTNVMSNEQVLTRIPRRHLKHVRRCRILADIELTRRLMSRMPKLRCIVVRPFQKGNVEDWIALAKSLETVIIIRRYLYLGTVLVCNEILPPYWSGKLRLE